MTLQEFVELIGGKHASVMVCHVDGSTHRGVPYKSGDMINVDRATSFALYKQMANKPDGGEEHRWLPKDVNMTASEEANLNAHFEKQFAIESGEKPIKVGKFKK